MTFGILMAHFKISQIKKTHIMKTKLLILVCSLVISSIANGQFKRNDSLRKTDTISKKIEKDNPNKKKINTNVFTLDLSKPSQNSMKSSENTRRLSFRSRDLLQFEIVGGNPFKYKYVINNKFINFFEDQFDNPIKSIENALKKEAPKVSETAEEKESNNKETINELANLKFKIQNDGLKNNIQNELLIKNNINTVNDTRAIRDIEIKIKNLEDTEYIASATYSMAYLKSTKNDYQYPKNIDEDKTNIISAIVDIRNNAASYLNKLVSHKRSLNSATELYIGSFTRVRSELRRESDTLIKHYLNIKKDVQKFSRVNEQYEKIESELKDDLTSILNELTILYNVKLDNYTLPIDVNGKNIDVVEVSLERFEQNSPVATDKYKYTIWVKGGFKIDVSGGVFITSLVNDEYNTENKSITLNGNEEQRKIIRLKEKGNFEFGFGSAINISHRSASWINPTLNFGALFTVNQQFQLLTGLGAILGKEERIIFSGGLSIGRVSRLSEAYVADGETLYDLGDSGVVPTSNQFDFGYYFGVTYNFSKNKKQNNAENK